MLGRPLLYPLKLEIRLKVLLETKRATVITADFLIIRR
jgi:hypothetical protein